MTDRDVTLLVCLPVLPEHKDGALDSGGGGNRVKWKEGSEGNRERKEFI